MCPPAVPIPSLNALKHGRPMMPSSSRSSLRPPSADAWSRPQSRSNRLSIQGHPFSAELDAAELDDRERPGAPWTAKAQIINRSHLVLLSRRMCFLGRLVIVAVHLVDDQPMILLGRTVECEYHGEGLYRVILELQKLTHNLDIDTWITERQRR